MAETRSRAGNVQRDPGHLVTAEGKEDTKVPGAWGRGLQST